MKEKAEYEIYEKTILERGFQNSGKMEEYIYQKSKENKITIEIIGSIEKSGTVEKERKGKVYIPYSITGKEENILKWIGEIENSEKLISLTDTPFQLNKDESEMKANLKISGYVLNDTLKEKSVQSIITENLFFNYNQKEIVIEKNTIEINGKIHIILKFKSGKRKILTDGEKIKKGKEWYMLRIQDKEGY